MSLTYPSSAQTQPWKKMQSPVNVTLRFMSFVDSLTGWAAGEAGTIIRTTDGGENWEIQNSTVQTFIMDIFFVDKNIGWALTLKDEFPFTSVILKTTNGGDEWTAENFPDSSKLIRTIFFFDSLNGLAGGSYFAYTSDGGMSWTEAEVDSSMLSNFPVYRFNFFSRQFGYACGGFIDRAGVIWRTTNGGLNWTSQGVSADEVFDIYILDSLNAITLSGDPEGLYPIAYLKTTNAGINWIYEELPYFGLSFRIDFRTYSEGWSASGYKFLLTTNRGETWEEFETPDSAVVYDIQFLNARTGYAVGEKGVVLKLDPTLVGVEQEINTPTEFILFQNYPNPFNPTTTLSFVISHPSFVKLCIYDVLGNEIATLVDEFKSAGSYEIEFSAKGGSASGGNTSSESSFRLVRNLASGIYFYQLRVTSPVRKDSFGEINSPPGQAEQELIQTKKMILLK